MTEYSMSIQIIMSCHDKVIKYSPEYPISDVSLLKQYLRRTPDSVDWLYKFHLCLDLVEPMQLNMNVNIYLHSRYFIYTMYTVIYPSHYTL